MDVTAIGEVLIDFTPAGQSANGSARFEQNAGGAPANVLAALSKWGKRTAFIGKVGNDPFGVFLKTQLEDAGIRTDGLTYTEEADTTLAFVHLEASGERSFRFCRNPGADQLLSEADLDEEALGSTRVLHFGSVSMTREPSATATLKAAASARSQGAIVSFDPNLRPSLWDDLEKARRQIGLGLAYADVVKLSREELVFLAGTDDLIAGSSQLCRTHPMRLLLVTLGEKGCFYRLGEAAGHVPGFRVQAVDTTGAGDAFCAGMLYGVLEREDGLAGLEERELRELIRFANAAGALAAAASGGIPAMPALRDVRQLASSSSDCEYEEPYRPQLHFTPPTGWMNDPNGMVYDQGEYHLFYQYYPDGTKWGPMHWGHAVSADLMRWEHLPVALEPDRHGTIFSGSAVVDRRDTSGFFGGGSGLVAVFTQHGSDPDTGVQRQRQSLAYSADKGRTWTMYADNPVLAEADLPDFRDPKVIWHEPSQAWVMVISAADHVRFYRSTNLKDWRCTGRFGGDGQGSYDGVWECPDLFELPVDGGDGEERKWVLIVSIGERADIAEGSRTMYFVGRFDGETFHNEPASDTVLWLDAGRDNYAGVTWSDVPQEDGRRLFIGWMSNWKYANLTPTDVWRGAMTVPRELRLFRTAEGVRLRQLPVRELEGLRRPANGGERLTLPAALASGERTELGASGRLLDLEAEFEWDEGVADLGIRLRSAASESEAVVIGYEPGSRKLYIDRSQAGESGFHPLFACRHDTLLEASDLRRLRLRIVADRCSVEIFANDGAAVLTDLIFPAPGEELRVEAFAVGGKAAVREAKLFELESIHRRTDAEADRR